MKKIVAIVAGDPDSINSEIIAKTWKKRNISKNLNMFIIGNYNLIRKQFFSSNPQNIDENFTINLIDEVSEIDIKFLHQKTWYQEWPVDPITQRKIPELIKLEFIKNNKEYTWIIEPNFDYVFKY